MSSGDPQPNPATGTADYSSVPFEDRISRRDLYAAAALSGILAGLSREEASEPKWQHIAIGKAFSVADRMLEQQGKARA